jgi:hypothetical protein
MMLPKPLRGPGEFARAILTRKIFVKYAPTRSQFEWDQSREASFCGAGLSDFLGEITGAPLAIALLCALRGDPIEMCEHKVDFKEW